MNHDNRFVLGCACEDTHMFVFDIFENDTGHALIISAVDMYRANLPFGKRIKTAVKILLGLETYMTDIVISDDDVVKLVEFIMRKRGEKHDCSKTSV